MKKGRVEKIDVKEIFQRHPWLRPDQRSVILFLAEKRRGAFEAEIRTALDIPKSTMWRIVKGLEEEGVVEVQQLRRQNYIKLRKLK